MADRVNLNIDEKATSGLNFTISWPLKFSISGKLEFQKKIIDFCNEHGYVFSDIARLPFFKWYNVLSVNEMALVNAELKDITTNAKRSLKSNMGLLDSKEFINWWKQEIEMFMSNPEKYTEKIKKIKFKEKKV